MANLGSNFLDFVANITQLWKNPGASSKGKQYQMNRSLLSGVDLDNMDSSSPLMTFFGQNKKQLRKELRNFHLVTAILGLYSSTILDAIDSSSLQITNAKEGHNKLTDFHLKDVNNFNGQINLKKFIRQNINDMLYYGKFVQALRINYPEEGRFVFESVIDPFDFYLIECKDQSYLAMYSDQKQLVQKNSKNFVYYFNELKTIDKIDDSICEDFIEDFYDDEEEFDSYRDVLPKSFYYTGAGILDDNLNLLMSIYLNEYLLDQLTIRDVTRKDIIIADVKDPKTPRTDVSSAMDDFNETFNNNFLYNGVTSSLQAMTALIATNVIYEGTAVLPGHENYTNFDVLDVPDLSKKKEDLADLQLAQRNKLFTNKGIPEGTFEGIGNKWDTLDDQSRFMTEIKNSLASIIEFIKEIDVKYLNGRYNLDLNTTDINLELSTTNTITNSKWTRDIGLQSKMFAEISSLLRTAKADANVENLYIDKEKYLQAINGALSVVNPSLENLILIDQTISSANDNTTDEEDNEDNDNSNQESSETFQSEIEVQDSEEKLQEAKVKLEEKTLKDQIKDQKQQEMIDSLKEKLEESKNQNKEDND